jgi:hypothetical protein
MVQEYMHSKTGLGTQQSFSKSEQWLFLEIKEGKKKKKKKIKKKQAKKRSTTLTMAWLNLDSISPSNQSKASPLSRNSSAMRREHSVDRRWILKSNVAFS